MLLLELPLDLFRTILERLVCDLGLTQAVHLRRINKLFDRETLRALTTTQVFGLDAELLVPSQKQRKTCGPPPRISPSICRFVARYMLQRPHTIRNHKGNQLSEWMNQVFDELATGPGGNPALLEDEETRLEGMRVLIKSICRPCLHLRINLVDSGGPEWKSPPPTEGDIVLSAIILGMVPFVKEATRRLDVDSISSNFGG
ncbi:uncharacterized protein K452DRAFT_362120 [Aplosporella prunicola CBS 121167]|uniref:F-box domain-containing protein n=1 Tax=Aplosporella prunicola CBS 121167 TaxID=1176127 RepID=A0A6A6B1H9_9PEZI|nr:uncharacterized protein K452DRAFT_362120 [Aplosporella prunicola CBS 121167]KAF2137084.1 hypothetical protein K452DRAFT_362120 [Aplosporella prunicola CBS 121167]